MSADGPKIDRELADGPLLSARSIPAEALRPAIEYLKTARADGGTVVVEQNPQRDRLLSDLRQRFTELVIHDAGYNLQQLWRWAVELDSGRSSRPSALGDGLIRHGFGQLGELRHFLIKTDAWSGGRAEISSWQAIQQFYCDALALGDRLLKFETGEPLRRRPFRSIRQVQPTESAAAYSLAQAAMNTFEQILPNALCWRPLRSVIPIALYTITRSAVPWPAYRWHTAASKLRKMVTSGAMSSMSEEGNSILEVRGRRELLSNTELFDSRTGKTLHNVVLVFGHRHSVLDIPILADVLHGIGYGMWANAMYFPKSAAHDPHLAMVKLRENGALSALLDQSAHILMKLRLPLLIAVDGGSPYLMYGQQMRVKRGIRLLIERMNKESESRTRRTYVVPLSLDDTASFIRGLDRKITVTFHQPISSEDIADAPQPPDGQRINFGDPLLNHLECHFLAHTGVVRHGWRTPRVVETVRRVADQRRGGGIRDWIRGHFQPSLYDLSRDQSAAEAELTGP